MCRGVIQGRAAHNYPINRSRDAQLSPVCSVTFSLTDIAVIGRYRDQKRQLQRASNVSDDAPDGQCVSVMDLQSSRPSSASSSSRDTGSRSHGPSQESAWCSSVFRPKAGKQTQGNRKMSFPPRQTLHASAFGPAGPDPRKEVDRQLCT